MKILYFFFFILTLSVFSACDGEDDKAIVPAFLTIENIDVKTTRSIEGSNNDKITDAWVFVQDQLIGSFELPATIPITRTGNINLKIRGGIFNNGMSNDRVIYPFYEFFILDTTFAPEEKITLNPIVQYKQNVVFDYPWSGENFESGINFIQHPNSQASLVRNTTDQVFEGLASGYAKLEENETFFEVYTPDFSDISRLGISTYLEMNYKSSHDITVSIYTDNRTAQYSVLVLRARDTWNKIYVDFTPVFSTLATAFNYNIAIGYQKPAAGTGEVHLDNIKLIHY